MAALAEIPRESIGPRVIGVHLEGPFLSPLRLGAHPVTARRDPDAALLERLLAAGPVSEMTLAPELEARSSSSTCCTRAESSCRAATPTRRPRKLPVAFDRGAATVTHLFNAMRPLGHRDPGIAGAALARDDVIVQVILDGHHLAEETARVVWRAAGGRVALVSDAIAAAGVGDGSYRLGDVDVEVRDGVARRADGVLAGSALALIEAVRRLHALDVPLADAVGAATAVPARIARRPDLGSLRPGADADIVVLDDALEIRTVFVGGEDLVAA